MVGRGLELDTRADCHLAVAARIKGWSIWETGEAKRVEDV